MALQGKGFYIWRLSSTEGGNPNAIADEALKAGLAYALIKIADGVNTFNILNGYDQVPAVVAALRARGIQAWGWQYVYGNDPVTEARVAIQRIRSTGVDGFVIDAEGEYKQAGKDEAARRYMAELRASLPTLPMALSSYRYPSYHPSLPWREFLEQVNYNMPQVYWVGAHNAGTQLSKSVSEFQRMTPYRPILPTGSAYSEGSWIPTDADMLDFLNTARNLNLPGVNFWSWEFARSRLPNLWNTIAAYPWAPGTDTRDISVQYVDALNARDPNWIVQLYTPNAVHITAERTVQGTEAIRAWYTSLFNQILPNGSFALNGVNGTGASRNITWRATSSAGNVSNGSDTFGLQGGKISYHYTFFKKG